MKHLQLGLAQADPARLSQVVCHDGFRHRMCQVLLKSVKHGDEVRVTGNSTDAKSWSNDRRIVSGATDGIHRRGAV